MSNKPYLIEFNSIGQSELGYISVAESSLHIPFEIKRCYWTYFTPQNVERGNHANIDKELVLIAVCGSIEVTTELQDGTRTNFILNKPNIGLYIPKLCWHTMKYSHNAIQVVIASNEYSQEDYIRSFDEFLNYGN